MMKAKPLPIIQANLIEAALGCLGEQDQPKLYDETILLWDTYRQVLKLLEAQRVATWMASERAKDIEVERDNLRAENKKLKSDNELLIMKLGGEKE